VRFDSPGNAPGLHSAVRFPETCVPLAAASEHINSGSFQHGQASATLPHCGTPPRAHANRQRRAGKQQSAESLNDAAHGRNQRKADLQVRPRHGRTWRSVLQNARKKTKNRQVVERSDRKLNTNLGVSHGGGRAVSCSTGADPPSVGLPSPLVCYRRRLTFTGLTGHACAAARTAFRIPASLIR